VTEKIVEGEEELAVRLEGGIVLSNANRLTLCGTHLVYGGSRSYQSGQSPAQLTLEKAGAIPVPFQVFQTAKLDLTKARVVGKAPAEVITISVERYKEGKHVREDETRHYVGACLLEVEGNQFLFDIDREELKHKIFNPFVVKLPKSCKTIEDAYLSLKPAKVLMAEMGGLKVQRQGEWFFVKRFDKLPELPKPPKELVELTENPPDAREMGASSATEYYKPGHQYGCQFPSADLQQAYDKKAQEWEDAVEKLRGYSPQAGELRQGQNRPNRVHQFVNYDGMVLVEGTVTHSGREHRDIHLEGWWEAIPNTAVQSWQVTGDVD
jgi:hypothetical protein